MKRYFVEELPEQMRRNLFDAEYTVFDNDECFEAARIIEPLSGNEFVLIQNDKERPFKEISGALQAINEHLGDFDLPDSLFALIRHNYSF
jgi:hypothetical protein